MSILIKGMEMPAKQVLAVINPDGLVEILDSDNILVEEFYAVPVPPHGRCIDADELPWYLKDVTEIVDAPTIIPAEEGET